MTKDFSIKITRDVCIHYVQFSHTMQLSDADRHYDNRKNSL